ncbi:hypothetical protein LO771_19750 [Streptacidiphilus sp. ASG 303]|uniref:hypothetical protein n=1 Tax=Streptacidiphilus sp. ASG 303 TaxID=2896847 RepID=UPI001E52714C|nr:hypothetical protein [Streptacidiphilus sp. ASG 303]MCD0484568.1 hypothetical protein [Streptacidiphilus sp. ASG 303]
MTALLLADALAAPASAGSRADGMPRPGPGLPQDAQATAGIGLHARAHAARTCAARALPPGPAAAWLLPGGGRSAGAPMLLVAGPAQAGDSVPGGHRRHLGTALGAGALAVLHPVPVRAVQR